ncbi:MAG: sodium:calcium antiporter [Halobacteriales archaeon]
MSRRSQGALVGAIGLTIPWLGVYATGLVDALDSAAVVAVSGLAVLGTSFLLAWAAETAEKDVPRAFAIAVLAVLAVAPEYAVDALYAWEAGQFVGTARGVEAGNLAVANMTGANRILIGIGWAGIALFTVFRRGADTDPAVTHRDGVFRSSIRIDREIGLDMVFLGLATLWAFLVPFGGGIGVVDTIVLVGLYVAYISIILNGDVDPGEEHHGVPRYLQSFRRSRRVSTVISLFLYAGIMLLIAVKPFAHGLEALGTSVGIPSFFMIQWIAPLASESPELIVVAYLVMKARSTAGFNTLISSKLNQWTLLIGTLVVVYAIALGRYGTLPFDQKQAGEIWLTAGQSFFALSLLVDFEFSVGEAAVLAALFFSQVCIEFVIVREMIPLPVSSYEVLLGFTAVYLVVGSWLFWRQRGAVRAVFNRTIETAGEAWRPIHTQLR